MPIQVFGVRSSPQLQSKSVTPSASTQYVTPSIGYDGLSQVTVSGSSNLVSSNIKNGVNIFGVTGSLEGKDYVMITATKTPTQYKSGSNYYHEMTITTPALTGWSGTTTKLAFYSIWCEDFDFYSNGLICASLLEENIIDSTLHGRTIGYKTSNDSYLSLIHI